MGFANKIDRAGLSGSLAWTGSRMIDVLSPDPDDIVIEEVAVGLSREMRYGGATTTTPWSVAQHSLLAVRLAEDDGMTVPRNLLTLLLHDAPEYMLRDVIRPVKIHLPDFHRIEAAWWASMSEKWSLPREMPGFVKHYDNLACACEKDALISPAAGDWPGLPRARRIPSDILNLSIEGAETAFLDKFSALSLARK